jgi:hypothetical protein
LYLFTVSFSRRITEENITACKTDIITTSNRKAFSLGAPQGQGLAEVHSLPRPKRPVFSGQGGQVGLKIQREKRVPAAFLACSRPVFASESSTQ